MFWQTLAGRVLEHSENGLRVLQNSHYRWLQFSDNAIQTLISRRTPHKPVMRYLKAITLAARVFKGSTCVLGVGGGAILHYLSHENPDDPLLAVEYSPQVLAVARRFFGLDTLSGLTVMEADAFDVLAHTDGIFDNILVDLATAEGLPSACFHEVFFKNSHRALASNGVLALNLSTPERHQALLQPLRVVFGETLSVPIRGCANIIVFATKHQRMLSLLNHAEFSAFFKRVEWTGTLGWVGWQ